MAFLVMSLEKKIKEDSDQPDAFDEALLHFLQTTQRRPH